MKTANQQKKWKDIFHPVNEMQRRINGNLCHAPQFIQQVKLRI